MRHDYQLKPRIPHKFVVLRPDEYEVIAEGYGYLNARIFGKGKHPYPHRFRLSGKGTFFINSGSKAQRKDESGAFLDYAIPAG